jgi:hypothetical protein
MSAIDDFLALAPDAQQAFLDELDAARRRPFLDAARLHARRRLAARRRKTLSGPLRRHLTVCRIVRPLVRPRPGKAVHADDVLRHRC